MAKLLQLRRGTTEQHVGNTNTNVPSFTGAVGEVTVDTTEDVLRVHDGALAGGHVMLGETQAKTFGYVHPVSHTAASLTIDLGNGSNHKIDFSTNAITSINVTNATEGQSGSIFSVHSVNGGLSGFTASKFLFTGGGGAPASSLTSGSVDRLDYIVYGATSGSEKLHCVFNVGVA